MRSARRWLTTRWLMVMVAAAGLIFWLSATAFNVYRDRETYYLFHYYPWMGTDPIHGPHERFSGHAAPFWPRYWRRLLGLPWPGSYVCTQGGHDAGFRITLATPVINVREPGTLSRVKQEALAEWERMRREKTP